MIPDGYPMNIEPIESGSGAWFLYILATVSQIDENAFVPGGILIVERNSYADDYAQQNGFCYRYPGSQELYGKIY